MSISPPPPFRPAGHAIWMLMPVVQCPQAVTNARNTTGVVASHELSRDVKVRPSTVMQLTFIALPGVGWCAGHQLQPDVPRCGAL